MYSATSYAITTLSLGEIRMGCTAYGINIKAVNGEFKSLEAAPILVGSDDWKNIVEASTCCRYLVIHGQFCIYILDLEEISVSLYRATIRGRIGEWDEGVTVWSEETPICGSNTFHLNGVSGKHYYLQFPFVRDSEFSNFFDSYHALRMQQIIQARKFA